MKSAKDKMILICTFVCGLSLAGVIIGMIAHLSDTLIRICGAVMLVAMVILAYNYAKKMKPKD